MVQNSTWSQGFNPVPIFPLYLKVETKDKSIRLHNTLNFAIVNMCAGNSQFLDDINQYRLSLSLPEFTANTGAPCLAQQVANRHKGTPCSNSTGTATVSGQEPLLDESLPSKCSLQLVNVKDGFMSPTCVPAGTSAANTPELAAANITMSQSYTTYVKNSKSVSAGAGSVDNQWFVLLLATNASGGNHVNQDLDPSPAFASRVSLAPISLGPILCLLPYSPA